MCKCKSPRLPQNNVSKYNRHGVVLTDSMSLDMNLYDNRKAMIKYRYQNTLIAIAGVFPVYILRLLNEKEHYFKPCPLGSVKNQNSLKKKKTKIIS